VPSDVLRFKISASSVLDMFLLFQVFYWKEARDFVVTRLILTLQSKILSFL